MGADYSFYVKSIAAYAPTYRIRSNTHKSKKNLLLGGELENQNCQLDRINMKAASDITRVKMANDKAAALMK